MARPDKDLPMADLRRLFVSTLRKTKQNPGIGAYRALPHQHKFHSSSAKGKLFIGGNRSGKTVGGACEAAMRLTGIMEYRIEDPVGSDNFIMIEGRKDLPKPPVRLRGVAVDITRGINLIMIPELKKWIPPSFLIKGSWEDSYSKSDMILTLENGSTIEFMSYEQQVEKFAGTSRHGIWFDEEPPEAIFNENMARLIDVGGRLLDYYDSSY